jgi:hypothetical protein
MKKTALIIAGFFLLLSISSNRSKNYVVATDIEKIATSFNGNGLTEEESIKQDKIRLDSMLKNTIGKSIPEIEVTTLSNQKLILGYEFAGNFIIVSCDAYCGFGLECITDLFPKAITKFNKNNKAIPVICLLKKTENDKSNSMRFNNTLKELKRLYQTIYIIDEKEAGKLNLLINPTRLYVNKDRIVTNMEFGIPTVEELCDEIKQNTEK